ncbi:MAG: hypothetical protein KME06_15500 [Kastovskya adunca ATA6-11-RM4]|jgi:photosystem II stability/assembly factor-like uncharacterized protein|nr:hypothetical protein [Kastovskya adunca ATA6-11-RM4]
MVNWLAIAKQLLPSLFIFAIGLYVAQVVSHTIGCIRNSRRRWLSQGVRFVILILFTAIALQPMQLTSNLSNFASGKAEVTNAQRYRSDARLGALNVALGGGGYVTGIYLHPRQQDLIYIRTDIGGFYRWDAKEQRWIALTDHFPLAKSNYYGGEALALDPNDPNIVYIAAGKYLWAEPGTIFKSTNKGQTWTKLNLDLHMGGNQDKRWLGERLVVSPFDSQLLFFGSRRDGLWKSSDAGKTWSSVKDFPGKPQEDIGITAIAFNDKQKGEIYINAYGDGIYQSTDSGKTWRKIPDSPQTATRLAVAVDGTLYVTSETHPRVSKYTQGVWQDLTPPGSQAEFNGLSLNATNPQEVLIATREKSENTNLYRSLDGGRTWREIKRSVNNTVPWWSKYMLSNPATSAIAFDPKVPNRVWLTDWYGIWRTDNINQQPSIWTNYQNGHEEVVPFTLVAPPQGAILLSGVADVDGFNHNNGLDTYPSYSIGRKGPAFQDTYSIAYSETDPLKLVRVGGNRWNNTYTGATSTDGGSTWKAFSSFPKQTMPLRVAMSATNPQSILVITSGGQPLYTTDGGASWKTASGLPSGMEGAWNWSQPLAADTGEGRTFYYYDKGKLYRSTDGGATFASVSESLPSDYWHFLKTPPQSKNEVWVSLDKKGLYRSIDGGNTFTKLEKIKRSHLFAFGKPKPGSKTPALYLYGEIAEMGEGIFRSLDEGKTWESIGDRSRPIGNEPNVMEASKQQFGLVFVGTNGRGIYYGTQ